MAKWKTYIELSEIYTRKFYDLRGVYLKIGNDTNRLIITESFTKEVFKETLKLNISNHIGRIKEEFNSEYRFKRVSKKELEQELKSLDKTKKRLSKKVDSLLENYDFDKMRELEKMVDQMEYQLNDIFEKYKHIAKCGNSVNIRTAANNHYCSMNKELNEEISDVDLLDLTLKYTNLYIKLLEMNEKEIGEIKKEKNQNSVLLPNGGHLSVESLNDGDKYDCGNYVVIDYTNASGDIHTLARVEESNQELHIYTYGNPHDDDFTNKETISLKDLENLD